MGTFAFGQSLVEGRLHGVDELGCKGDGLVVLSNQVIDAIDVAICRVAAVGAGAGTEQVHVLVAVPGGGFLHHHPTDEPLLATVSAEQAALEIVVVNSPPFAGHAVLVEHHLDAVERFLIDQCFMATGNLLFALIDDDAEVVAVAEDSCPLLGADRLSSPLR
ncbi:hypothetical protein [Nocardia brasiliensis]|uniref:hypothetical protein n=1 Tax=Nocardia brasiliensis TaxID=37326 RepID=UPI003D92C1DA